ncbi:MAG: hypothetical protein NTZ94_07435 [Verrucomicrobia bacterium]|nr:hypothetical protein [Verrucomicrobiota bacterium]
MSNKSVHVSAPVSQTAVLMTCACVVLLAIFRVLHATVLTDWPNFSPMAAVAFCGGFLLPGWMAWGVPLGALFISDLLLAAFLGYPAFGLGQTAAWLSLALIVAIGRGLAARSIHSLTGIFSGLFAGGILFYFITNAVCWLTMPAYPRGLDGLWMSLTTGLPGFPPSWLFFRNSLISDFLFASSLLALWSLARSRRQSAIRENRSEA